MIQKSCKFFLEKFGFKINNIDLNIFLTKTRQNREVLKIFANNIKIIALKDIKKIK